MPWRSIVVLCYHRSMPATDDPVLIRFRAALDAAYGDRVERVVLFGSRARGDHRPDSDYDVAVFLRDFRSFGREIEPLAAIETEILSDTGALISPLPMPDGSYEEQTGLMHEMRREGIDL
jgi:predicted nucleotidyltransferase